MEKLRPLAEQTLAANIIKVNGARYLAAGGHQFGSLWTRDFCFAARGLILSGHADVARTHLTHLITSRRADGVIARILESVPSWKRVVMHTAFRFLPNAIKEFPLRPPPDMKLTAEHVGEHGTISIDSNALVLRLAADLQKMAPDAKWLSENKNGLQEVLHFCLERTDNGRKLVVQGAYEDWQDSASRHGETFYVNLLFALAFRSARELGLSLPDSTQGFAQLVRARFFSEARSLFRTHADLEEQISLDGNCLVISENLYPELNERVYQALKKSTLWSRAEIPGVATYPDYPKEWISWTTAIVGLRHYHDQILWSWLSASAAKAALMMGDRTEAVRIFDQLERMAIRDGGISEIHRPVAGLPMFETWLYRSENPFSWGAGMTIEAVHALQSMH